MKNTSKAKPKPRDRRDLRAEYKFDYSKARPNRFVGKRGSKSVVVLLDSVNAALRALLTAIPLPGNKRKRA
jgi:hypothetical protein